MTIRAKTRGACGLPLGVLLLAFLILAGCGLGSLSRDDTSSRAVQVGSKKFTESVILAEIATRLIESAGAPAAHRAELGGTRILWNALLRGDLDIYPEYTGTLIQEILAGEGIHGETALRIALLRRGIRMGRPLGFDNTYTLGMAEHRAAEMGIRSFSDLLAHPDLRFGFTAEFLDRADGWPGLRDAYRLPQRAVRGLDHDVAYRGLAKGSIDVTDLYSTDAEIRALGLRVLEDDRKYFPEYVAVLLWRADMERSHPRVVEALHRIESLVPEPVMIAMNARVKIDGVPESRVAGEFLQRELGIPPVAREDSVTSRLARHTREHLVLVGISLGAAILFSIPLGILGATWSGLGQAILAIVGVVQTIPSLALLVFMIPLLGIGAPPAILALFLYSLLPIVRNTVTALRGIPEPLRESADALGLSRVARLRLVDLPLASGAILAGIKTSAVLNVGTATLGALIGAGGYGQPILTGIRLDNVGLILEGAVPAATLAVAVQGAFELADRWLVPKGLRLERGR